MLGQTPQMQYTGVQFLSYLCILSLDFKQLLEHRIMSVIKMAKAFDYLIKRLIIEWSPKSDQSITDHTFTIQKQDD